MPVAVIIDNSAAATPNIADLRRGLTTFIKAIDGLGPVALVTVASRPTIARDYTSDQKALLDTANRLFAEPDSGATLLDAIADVSKGLGKREGERAAIVIVTTENVDFSHLHYTEVLESVKSSGGPGARDRARQPFRLAITTTRRVTARPSSTAGRARAAACAPTS